MGGVVQDFFFNTASLLLLGSMIPLGHFYILIACSAFAFLTFVQLLLTKFFYISYWPKKLHLIFFFAATVDLIITILDVSIAEKYCLIVLHGILFSFVIVGLRMGDPFTLEFSMSSIISIEEIREIPYLFRKYEIIAAYWALGYFIMLCADIFVYVADMKEWNFSTFLRMAIYDCAVILGNSVALVGKEFSLRALRTNQSRSSSHRNLNAQGSFLESPNKFGNFVSISVTDDEDRAYKVNPPENSFSRTSRKNLLPNDGTGGNVLENSSLKESSAASMLARTSMSDN